MYLCWITQIRGWWKVLHVHFLSFPDCHADILNQLQNGPRRQCWAHRGLRHVPVTPSQQPGSQWGHMALFKAVKHSRWLHQDWQQMHNFLL